MVKYEVLDAVIFLSPPPIGDDAPDERIVAALRFKDSIGERFHVVYISVYNPKGISIVTDCAYFQGITKEKTGKALELLMAIKLRGMSNIDDIPQDVDCFRIIDIMTNTSNTRRRAIVQTNIGYKIVNIEYDDKNNVYIGGDWDNLNESFDSDDDDELFEKFMDAIDEFLENESK